MDVEGNGLLDEITKLWCIVAEDIDTNELFIFHDFPQFNNAEVVDPFDNKTYKIPKRNGTLIEGVKFLMGASFINCHNFFGYDYFVLKMFYSWFKISLGIARDTLIPIQVAMV